MSNAHIVFAGIQIHSQTSTSHFPDLILESRPQGLGVFIGLAFKDIHLISYPGLKVGMRVKGWASSQDGTVGCL